MDNAERSGVTYKVEAILEGSHGGWQGNNEVFHDVAGAEKYAMDVLGRWCSQWEWRVVDSNGVVQEKLHDSSYYYYDYNSGGSPHLTWFTIGVVLLGIFTLGYAHCS